MDVDVNFRDWICIAAGNISLRKLPQNSKGRDKAIIFLVDDGECSHGGVGSVDTVPMITLRLCGGLGNQLFQLALGIAFSSRGRNVKYDLTLLDADCGRRYLLGDFGFELNAVREDAPVTYQEQSLRFDPSVLELKEGVLNGYFQSEKYFQPHELYIHGTIFNRTRFSPETLAVAQKIKEAGENSCFVHVRRSDNLRANSMLYHGLTDAANAVYYGRALKMLLERLPVVQFFMFSDDAKWCAQNFCETKSLTIVTHNAPSFSVDETHNLHKNDSGREVEDLWLMSLCRHAIIANSTFSYWGAWLNQFENIQPRIVIAPDPWFSGGDLDATDIIPERWTKVGR